MCSITVTTHANAVTSCRVGKDRQAENTSCQDRVLEDRTVLLYPSFTTVVILSFNTNIFSSTLTLIIYPLHTNDSFLLLLFPLLSVFGVPLGFVALFLRCPVGGENARWFNKNKKSIGKTPTMLLAPLFVFIN